MTSPLSQSIELHHVQGIVRAMYEVAKTDGVHATELVMIRGFYDSCQQDADALATFDDLIATPFDADNDAALFDTTERKATLLQSCLLLAHADGDYSDGERTKIAGIARTLGVEAEQLAQIEDAVADMLLQQISRISNTDALREVAAEIAAK